MTSAAVPADTASAGRRHGESTGVQVFARDVRDPDGPLFYLARGQADTVRADVNAGQLICPIEDCEDRRFVVRGGSKRDGFAHKPGVHGHGKETLAHHTSKHLVAAWLRSLYPDAHIDVDTREVENGQRPDVTLTLADGFVVAYEVQFAYLDHATWQKRHDGYRAIGVKDVWLFGGRVYDRSPGGPDTVAMHSVMDAVLSARHPMLLIDPWEETVAFGRGGRVDELLAAAGVRAPFAGLSVADVPERTVLAGVPAARGVIDLPGLREQMRKAQDAHPRWLAYLAERAERERAEAAENERRERENAEAAARRDRLAPAIAAARAADERLGRLIQERAEREKRAVEEQRRAVHAERSAAWADTRTVLEAVIGPLPDVVDSPPHDAELLIVTDAPDQWRWEVLYMLTRHAGTGVNPGGLSRCVHPVDGLPPNAVASLIWDFMRVLRRTGWVWWWGSTHPDSIEGVRVLASLDRSPVNLPVPGALNVKVVGRLRSRAKYADQVNGPPPQGIGTPPGVYGTVWRYSSPSLEYQPLSSVEGLLANPVPAALWTDSDPDNA